MNIRKLALRLLDEHEENGAFVNLSLQNHMADALSDKERASLAALLYTTVEKKLTLDYFIGVLAKRSLDAIEVHTKNILRLGMCQILYMKNIPDFAAVNETVKLARADGERRFVNFILRETVRQKDALPYPSRDRNVARYLSVVHSTPQWIVKTLISSLGEDEAEQYLVTINEQSPLTIAVNTTKISREEYLDVLEKEGVRAEPCQKSPRGVRILSRIRPNALYGFADGLFFVQDEASQLVSEVLSPMEGECIVDTCACPGGKSFDAAIAMNDTGEVYSFDLHESKLPLIIEGALRLGLSSVRAELCDAREGMSELFGKADGVIADVPCSGLGVLSKKPDLRYKSEESVKELPTLSYEILSKSAEYLKVGGTLIFSTCTVRREENEDVLYRFLDAHSDFSLVPFVLGGREYRGGVLKTYPHIDGTDGFFIAKLKKIR